AECSVRSFLLSAVPQLIQRQRIEKRTCRHRSIGHNSEIGHSTDRALVRRRWLDRYAYRDNSGGDGLWSVTIGMIAIERKERRMRSRQALILCAGVMTFAAGSTAAARAQEADRIDWSHGNVVLNPGDRETIVALATNSGIDAPTRVVERFLAPIGDVFLT